MDDKQKEALSFKNLYWLLDLLSGNEAPKKTLTEAVQAARGNLGLPTVPIRFDSPASHAAESAPQLDAEDPAEPGEDVVSRMCKAYMAMGTTDRYSRVAMTAALAVAREGYWSQEDVEKAILAQARGFQVIPVDELAEFLKQALAPKPSLAAKTGGAK